MRFCFQSGNDASTAGEIKSTHLFRERSSLRNNEHNDVTDSNSEQPAGLQHRLHVAGCLQSTRKISTVDKRTSAHISFPYRGEKYVVLAPSSF